MHRISDYDFDLPEGLIAQAPPAQRTASRMLVVHRASGTLEDRAFADLPRYVRPGDAVVLNDTRVFPAKLVGRRVPGGGHAEALLLREVAPHTWTALARPGRKLKPGTRLDFGDGRLPAEVVAAEGRTRTLRFEPQGEGLWDAFDAVGQTPLPPYIRREGPEQDRLDRARYQTVYAAERGAVAAPTAGLHFTPDVLQGLETQGARLARVTLHVGYGTFEPVHVENLEEHRVAPERIRVPEAAAQAIAQTRADGGRVLAVGTTTTRTLEASGTPDGLVTPGAGEADLTITPGYRFQVVDGLLTNFHLPQSSLLVLVATFGGRDLVLEAYRHAVREGYRFYSYGDCMLVL